MSTQKKFRLFLVFCSLIGLAIVWQVSVTIIAYAAHAVPVQYGYAPLATTGAINGVVTNSTGQPVTGMKVVLYASVENPNGPPSPIWVRTGAIYQTFSDGRYEFLGLAPGSYQVGVERHPNSPDLYVPEFYNNVYRGEDATPISVQAGQIRTNINFQLDSKGRISGRVTNRAGDPLENADVVAEQVNTGDKDSAITDSNGVYTLTASSLGSYRLHFSETNFGGPIYGYASQYYNNSPTAEGATLLNVTAGNTLTGINAQLGRMGAIAGTVYNQKGEPLERIQVTLYIPGWRRSPSHSSIYTDQNGRYTIDRVDNGIYRLEFADVVSPIQYGTKFYQNASSVESATDITVTSEITTNNIDIVLTANGIVSGLVTSAVGTALDQIQVNIWYYDTSFPGFESWEIVATTQTNANGYYETEPITNGEYRIEFSDLRQPAQYVKEFYDNKPDPASALPITVTRGQITSVNAQLALADPQSPPPTPPISNPHFLFIKSVGIQSIDPECTETPMIKVPQGTTIVYCYTILNGSDFTWTNHSLVDDKLGVLLDNLQISVAPGTSYSAQFTQTLMVATTNVATWTATTMDILPSPTNGEQGTTVWARESATVVLSAPTDDQDDDTIPDNLEGATDIDNDSIPNFLDSDSNGDGTSDQVEATLSAPYKVLLPVVLR